MSLSKTIYYLLITGLTHKCLDMTEKLFSFEHPNHLFKLVDKKIIILLKFYAQKFFSAGPMHNVIIICLIFSTCMQL